MKIEIWSDFVCPFCYIGKANLFQALAELNIDNAEIVWRSFELDPTYPAHERTSHYQLLQDKYQLDLQAAIVGTALYLGKFTLAEALRTARDSHAAARR